MWCELTGRKLTGFDKGYLQSKMRMRTNVMIDGGLCYFFVIFEI
jgi:hypothetical protein